jgi:hypothetical protein
MVDRAEPQVRRLALIYSVMDRSSVTRLVHLKAALELWRYCEQSALYLFADAPGLGIVGRVEEFLRRRGGWVPYSALYRKLEPVKTYHLRSALDQLVASGVVEHRRVPTRGRPRDEYRVLKEEKEE